MDTHDGDVQSVTYTAVIEGVTSQAMTYSTPFTMKGSETVRMKLPLTIPTSGAALLLDKLNAGKALSFTVTGKFTADTFLGVQELTLNTSGTANVSKGIESFFIQPTVRVDESQGFYVNSVSLPFPMGTGQVGIQVKYTMVSNQDTNSATVKKIMYTVKIQGVESKSMTNTPSTPIPVAPTGQAGSEIVLTNLPVDYAYSEALWTAVNFASSGSYYVNYTIVGTVLVNALLDGTNMDFYLPINISGTNTLLYNP